MLSEIVFSSRREASDHWEEALNSDADLDYAMRCFAEMVRMSEQFKDVNRTYCTIPNKTDSNPRRSILRKMVISRFGEDLIRKGVTFSKGLEARRLLLHFALELDVCVEEAKNNLLSHHPNGARNILPGH
jgi:hypothetical protein